jgi:hypothetical protein
MSVIVAGGYPHGHGPDATAGIWDEVPAADAMTAMCRLSENHISLYEPADEVPTADAMTAICRLSENHVSLYEPAPVILVDPRIRNYWEVDVNRYRFRVHRRWKLGRSDANWEFLLTFAWQGG